MKKIIITLLLTITCIGSLLVFTPKLNALLIGSDYYTGWIQCDNPNGLGVNLQNSYFCNYPLSGGGYLSSSNPTRELQQSNLKHYFLYDYYGRSMFTSSNDYLYFILGGLYSCQDEYDGAILNYEAALNVIHVFAYYSNTSTFNYNDALNSSVPLADFSTDFLHRVNNGSYDEYWFNNDILLALNFNYSVSFNYVLFGFYIDFSDIDFTYDNDYINFSAFVNSFTSLTDYSEAYNDGNIKGQSIGYTIGFNDGSTSGYNNGHYDGYIEGLNVGRSESDTWFANGLLTIFTIPFGVFSSIWNFDVLGINISNIVLALLSLGIVAWVIKKIFLSR